MKLQFHAYNTWCAYTTISHAILIATVCYTIIHAESYSKCILLYLILYMRCIYMHITLKFTRIYTMIRICPAHCVLLNAGKVLYNERWRGGGDYMWCSHYFELVEVLQQYLHARFSGTRCTWVSCMCVLCDL